MAQSDLWRPKVEERAHPPGEVGVRLSLEEVAKRAGAGSRHPRVNTWARNTLEAARNRGQPVKTARQRATVLLRQVQKKLWVPDPVGTEYIAGAHLLACDDESDGAVCIRAADCFPESTLLLTDEHELVPVENLRPGMRIWGLDRWSSVEAVAYKGVLPIDVVKLNNGSELKLTDDHHVYVLDCDAHPMIDSEGRALPADTAWRGKGKRSGCSCDMSARTEKRIRVSELRAGMTLPQPKRLPFGTCRHQDAPQDHHQAYVEGLYISDGWAEYKYNKQFCISGQDGCPKEAQKKEVQEICVNFGIPTTWARKYITVRNRDWTLRVQRMGHYAPEKHLLTLDLDESRAAASLRGVMADSGKNTRAESRTFTTTSYQLAVQVRVLHRMFGISCGIRYIENHGGLGKNPIWRLGTRTNQRSDERHPWLLRVKRIDRHVISVPCWDIQTDDHRVYLPEHDVTVSNCDELVVVLAAALSSVGIYTMIVGHAYDAQQRIEHVLCAVHLEGKWHYADPSTDLPLGRCVPFSRERLLSMPNVQVLCDAASCLTTRAFDPSELNFVDRGVFVGVDGPPQMTLEGLASRLAWIADDEMTLGQTLIDLSDPATLRDVKQMMSMIKEAYRDTSPTWSTFDWQTYDKIYGAVAEGLKVNESGGVSYEQDGKVKLGSPPAGTIGFPSFLGIENMVAYLQKLGIVNPGDEKTLFPNIAKYGTNVSGVTAPVFGPPPSASRGGGVSPLLVGLLALGGLGIVLASSRRAEGLA